MRVTAQIDGQTVHGFAADNLIPKWFTKDPNTAYRDEIDDMLGGDRSRHRAAANGESPSAFALWQKVWQAQEQWARREKYSAAARRASACR